MTPPREPDEDEEPRRDEAASNEGDEAASYEGDEAASNKGVEAASNGENEAASASSASASSASLSPLSLAARRRAEGAFRHESARLALEALNWHFADPRWAALARGDVLRRALAEAGDDRTAPPTFDPEEDGSEDGSAAASFSFESASAVLATGSSSFWLLKARGCAYEGSSRVPRVVRTATRRGLEAAIAAARAPGRAGVVAQRLVVPPTDASGRRVARALRFYLTVRGVPDASEADAEDPAAVFDAALSEGVVVRTAPRAFELPTEREEPVEEPGVPVEEPGVPVEEPAAVAEPDAVSSRLADAVFADRGSGGDLATGAREDVRTLGAARRWFDRVFGAGGSTASRRRDRRSWDDVRRAARKAAEAFLLAASRSREFREPFGDAPAFARFASRANAPKVIQLTFALDEAFTPWLVDVEARPSFDDDDDERRRWLREEGVFERKSGVPRRVAEDAVRAAARGKRRRRRNGAETIESSPADDFAGSTDLFLNPEASDAR